MSANQMDNLLELAINSDGKLTRVVKEEDPVGKPFKINTSYYEFYNQSELMRRNDMARRIFKNLELSFGTEEVLEAKDDELRSETWTQALRTAGYYYQRPTNEDRYRMMNYFDLHFSGILSQTKDPEEVPDLRNNRKLIRWTCKKYNEFLELKGISQTLNCATNQLLREYGPNTEKVKEYLGGRDFFI